MTAGSNPQQRFGELYRALASPILAYAARRTTSAQDAADVMAETFVVAWQRIDDVPVGNEARPWLYGVARRVLANHHRGVRRQQLLSERIANGLADAVRASVTPSEGAPDPRTWRGRVAVDEMFDDPAVYAALQSLNESDRELLMLVAWDDLTRSEIAVVLECSSATVRVRLHRARSRFRTALDAHRATSPTAHSPEPTASPAAARGIKELS